MCGQDACVYAFRRFAPWRLEWKSKESRGLALAIWGLRRRADSKLSKPEARRIPFAKYRDPGGCSCMLCLNRGKDFESKLTPSPECPTDIDSNTDDFEQARKGKVDAHSGGVSTRRMGLFRLCIRMLRKWLDSVGGMAPRPFQFFRVLNTMRGLLSLRMARLQSYREVARGAQQAAEFSRLPRTVC
ncbi:hypothetical protein IG631_15128 [Alternaria alternata]|nr:hypothetical protein IG631_15128 [Alternaria alternata]